MERGPFSGIQESGGGVKTVVDGRILYMGIRPQSQRFGLRGEGRGKREEAYVMGGHSWRDTEKDLSTEIPPAGTFYQGQEADRSNLGLAEEDGKHKVEEKSGKKCTIPH